MKKVILILFVLGTLFSCSKDDNYDSEKYPQKWQLIEMTGQVSSIQGTTGNEMEWQEFYLLNSNGTFIKHRERDGVQSEALGTFSVVDQSGDKFLELVYDTNSEIIGSCYGNHTETLWIISENKLMGTWSYCDGPGLEYKRVD